MRSSAASDVYKRQGQANAARSADQPHAAAMPVDDGGVEWFEKVHIKRGV
jgi:hypothetical protein